MAKRKPKYKRIMLKLSGEVLGGKNGFGFDRSTTVSLCKEIAGLQKEGIEIAIVMGGGNLWRYRDNRESGLDRVTSDTIGMVATIINSMYFRGILEELGAIAEVCSAIDASGAVPNYYPVTARKHLKEGKIVICAGGTGSPFFTTDSAAALRSLELKCDVFLKATKVDYVYDKDPMKYKNAKKFKKLSYSDVLKKNLSVIDMTAISLCKEGRIPIIVFNLTKKGNIIKAAHGGSIGTIIN